MIMGKKRAIRLGEALYKLRPFPVSDPDPTMAQLWRQMVYAVAVNGVPIEYVKDFYDAAGYVQEKVKP